MSASLTLTLIQADLVWENPTANREQFERAIRTLQMPTDVILLPEMFSTGFSMHPEQLAEDMNGPTLDWMRAVSAGAQADLAGSLIIREHGRFFNRFIWMKPDGHFEYYDKRHLFRMAGEDRKYMAGKQRVIINVKGWKVLPLLCYDLRFPVWARNRDNEYDILVYAANWPERRISHWDSLLTARAVENQAYVAAVNRVGLDGTGVMHTGHSRVVDYLGRIKANLGESARTQTVTLEKEELERFRQKFPVWKDADTFSVYTE